METILSWVGAALGALFVVAAVVAWWEHLVRSSRPVRPHEPATPRAVSVDVQLDALPPVEPPASVTPAPAAAPAPPPASDAAQRRATLDGAMSRMARGGQDDNAWTETSPMVLHPPAEAPATGPTTAPVPAGEPAPTPTRA
jgi:alpha,alpha-trehalase